MKYLDILSDKIDYLFRRGKNADDRCYDFFIRTVTFLLITLIVLCYGSFVHAEGNTLISYYNIDTSLLTNPSEIKWNHADVNKFMNIKMNTTNVDYRDLPSGGNPIQPILYFSPMPDLNSNYVLIEQTSGDWEEIWFIPKSYVDSGDMVLVADGEDTRIYSSVDYTFILYSVNYNDVSDPEKYRLYDIRSVSAGSSIRPGQFEPAWSYHAAWSNAPYYLTSTLPSYSDVQDFVNNGMIDDYPDFYNSNYYTFMDGLLDQPWDNVESVESNANHNYLNDIQIGLTSQNLRQNILSSQVIIGCDVDDWILNNLDDYSLYVNYKIYIKDSYQSSPNDPEFNYSVILPLRTFYNNAYTYSVAELFRNCTNSSNQSFQSYFNIVGEGQRVLSEQPYNAIIPCFLETIYQGLGKYYVTPDPEYQTIPYTIFQFKLDVSCSLTYQGMSSDDASGIYLKEFDFKNGSESVKVADILRNENPWEGESEPQQSPIVPSAGGYPSGNGSSGSVNVNVDVSGQKIPIGVKTKQEIQIILDNYKEVNDTFMDNWEALSDPNNDNNFMSFISDETKELPAVDYMIKGACAIFGLSIILFVLKVLLF